MISKIGEKGIYQIIYVPVRTKRDIGINSLDGDNYSFQYDHILNKSDKFFYHRKIAKTLKSLKNKVELTEINICHAHTLFSDGGVAYLLYKKYNIPYIVSVRNTDLNLYLKYLIHLRTFGIEIIKNASRVIFTNHDYKNLFLKKYFPSKLNDPLIFEVIPNGVDDFWIENTAKAKKYKNTSELSVLYVGTFLKNKNVALLIQTMFFLAKKKKDHKFTLNLVGGGGRGGIGKGDEKVYKKIDQSIKIPNLSVNYHGRINDLETLKNLYIENDIFILISRKENFGLSFIEALSQGTPILFTNGQGVSSFFKNEIVGCGIDRFNSKEIISKINKIIENYNVMSANAVLSTKRFGWNNIADKYDSIYKLFSKN
jgi:glycosyltransferase involved in cell wall biosynthesis